MLRTLGMPIAIVAIMSKPHSDHPCRMPLPALRIPVRYPVMMPPRNRHPSAEPPRNHARFARTTVVPDSNASASHSDDSNANSARPTTAPPKTAPQLITGRVEARTVARAGAIEISRAICILLRTTCSHGSPVPGPLHVPGGLAASERVF